MKRKPKSKPLALLLAETALASWETIAHRTTMMAAGRCSDREYRRMVTEKLRAAQRSGLSLMTGALSPDLLASLLHPWHRGARSNAKRLRRRR
jgi:hypothetical protein